MNSKVITAVIVLVVILGGLSLYQSGSANRGATPNSPYIPSGETPVVPPGTSATTKPVSGASGSSGSGTTVGLLRACPEEWIDNQMPTVGTPPARRDYYIYQGVRREVSEFDEMWVRENCKLEKQTVY